MIKYDLEALEKAADEACVYVKSMQHEIDEAVNWGDFGCRVAEYWADSNNDSGYRVWIEEASPACPKVHALIADFLTAAGFDDVEVHTEW